MESHGKVLFFFFFTSFYILNSLFVSFIKITGTVYKFKWGKKKKKGRKSLESTSFNQAVFYDPAAPLSLLDFGGCEVTCVNVPPRGREANTNWGIDRFKWSRNTRRNSGSNKNEYWGAGHAGTLMVFIHCSFMQVNILLSTVTWVCNSSVLS